MSADCFDTHTYLTKNYFPNWFHACFSHIIFFSVTHLPHHARYLFETFTNIHSISAFWNCQKALHTILTNKVFLVIFFPRSLRLWMQTYLWSLLFVMWNKISNRYLWICTVAIDFFHYICRLFCSFLFEFLVVVFCGVSIEQLVTCISAMMALKMCYSLSGMMIVCFILGQYNISLAMLVICSSFFFVQVNYDCADDGRMAKHFPHFYCTIKKDNKDHWRL